MGVFKKKSKEETTIASPPEESESSKEVKYVEELSEPEVQPTEEITEKEEITYREIPVCMSQTQINNLVVENNIMLKQIISEMD